MFANFKAAFYKKFWIIESFLFVVLVHPLKHYCFAMCIFALNSVI